MATITTDTPNVLWAHCPTCHRERRVRSGLMVEHRMYFKARQTRYGIMVLCAGSFKKHGEVTHAGKPA